MDKTRYLVSCQKCKGNRIVDIQKSKAGEFIDWLEDRQSNSPIISARPRLDGQWGFQCMCGNNDIMTDQEKRVIVNPTAPKPQEIDQIVANLKPGKPKFKLERV